MYIKTTWIIFYGLPVKSSQPAEHLWEILDSIIYHQNQEWRDIFWKYSVLSFFSFNFSPMSIQYVLGIVIFFIISIYILTWESDRERLPCWDCIASAERRGCPACWLQIGWSKMGTHTGSCSSAQAPWLAPVRPPSQKHPVKQSIDFTDVMKWKEETHCSLWKKKTKTLKSLIPVLW